MKGYTINNYTICKFQGEVIGIEKIGKNSGKITLLHSTGKKIDFNANIVWLSASYNNFETSELYPVSEYFSVGPFNFRQESFPIGGERYVFVHFGQILEAGKDKFIDGIYWGGGKYELNASELRECSIIDTIDIRDYIFPFVGIILVIFTFLGIVIFKRIRKKL